MNKKLTKYMASILCLLIVTIGVFTPFVSNAAGSESIIHHSSDFTFYELGDDYNLSDTEHISGIGYRVIAVKGDTENYDVRSVVNNVFNKSGTDYFNAFSSTSEASTLVLAIDDKSPTVSTVYLTVDGRVTAYPETRIIRLNMGNSGPLTDMDTEDSIINKYLTRLMYGTLTMSEQEIYDDCVFDYLMKKWCGATGNNSWISSYESYKNVPGSPIYYAIEFYYLNGSHELSLNSPLTSYKAVLGSVDSLAKGSGISNNNIWRNRCGSITTYTNILSSLFEDSINSDDRLYRLSRLVNQFKSWGTIGFNWSIKGNNTGSLVAGVEDYYGRMLFVPRTNSGEVNAPITTKPISSSKLGIKASRSLDYVYLSSVGYAYNEIQLGIDCNDSTIAELKNIVQSSAYTNKSVEDRNNIRNIKLTISVGRDGAVQKDNGFVSGWKIGGLVGKNLVTKDSQYPLKDGFIYEDYCSDAVKKDDNGKYYYTTYPGSRVDLNGLLVGSVSSVEGGTVDYIGSYELAETVNERYKCWDADIVDQVLYNELLDSTLYKWNYGNLQWFDFYNYRSNLDSNYKTVCIMTYKNNSVDLGDYDEGMEIRMNGTATAVIVKNVVNGKFYEIPFLASGSSLSFATIEGDKCIQHSLDKYTPSTTSAHTSEGDSLLDDSRFNKTDISRTDYSRVTIDDSGRIGRNSAAYHQLAWEDTEDYDHYDLVLYFSTNEFMDFIDNGGISVILSANIEMSFTIDMSIQIVNSNKVFGGLSYEDSIMNFTRKVVAFGTPTDAYNVTSWKIATTSTPNVYAEIKANNLHGEDWDVMSGIPTTENLWIGVGADQYRVSLSGALFTIGSPKALNGGSIIGNPSNWHITSDVSLNYNYPGLTTGSLPDTIGNYWGQLSQINSQDPTVDRLLEASAGRSKGRVDNVKMYGTPESNSAIYRVTEIHTRLGGYWGDNTPCSLSCGGHTVGSWTGSCGEDIEVKGWGAEGTAAATTCPVCGENIPEVKVTNPQQPLTGGGTEPTNHANNKHECSCSFTWNCSTGTLTFTTSKGSPQTWTHNTNGDLNKYNQCYELKVSHNGTHGTKSYTNESYKNETLIDDGWTLKSTHGCGCDNKNNMNHAITNEIYNYIYETYDMYVVQTIENWQVQSFIGAYVSDMDPVLFKDTVMDGNGEAKKKKYGFFGSESDSGYYAASTLPFGARLWKTGVLYNGWCAQWVDEGKSSTEYGIDYVYGREALLAAVGADNPWYEKRNGRISFSGSDTMNGWDSTGDAADYKCPVCYNGNRNYCTYHCNGEAKAIVDSEWYTINYWNSIYGNQRIELIVTYDSEFLRDYYGSSPKVHSDPASVLKNASNSAGIRKHKSQAFDKYAANVSYNDASDSGCWSYRISTGYAEGNGFYCGDIGLDGCPFVNSSAVEAYLTDALNLFCRFNGFVNGDINGEQFGYSAYCMSDVFDVGYEDYPVWCYDSPVITNSQMIVEHGYRIGNDLNIYGSDFTGPNQAHVYNHYSQWDVNQIKYSMMQCWIGDETNPMSGAARRHIDNLGNYILTSGYSGSQIMPKYKDVGEYFHSDHIMTLLGQYLRRDFMLGLFQNAAAGKGISGKVPDIENYTGHGSTGTDLGNGDRGGYYAQCYMRQGDEDQMHSPADYKYGLTCEAFVTTASNIASWSYAGYWDVYPSDLYYQFGVNDTERLNLGMTKLADQTGLKVYKSVKNSNQWDLALWNMQDWSSGHFEWTYGNDEYDGTAGYSEYGRYLNICAPGQPWQYYNISNYFDSETKGNQFKEVIGGDISFHVTDNAVMNAVFYGDYAYCIISNITMWPYAPNGVYSNPVTVKAKYYPFFSYTASELTYPMLPLKMDTGYTASYTRMYVNERGFDSSKQYDPTVANSRDEKSINDIVIHNPVSCEYSTVISNGVTGVSSSEIPGFIDESGKDMRYGLSNVYSYAGGSVVRYQYQDLEEWQKHDYWVIGNTCNIWVSDLGDFKESSSEQTTNLYSPTVALGNGSNNKGTKKVDGKIHINNQSVSSAYDRGGGGYADEMLTSQWIAGRYVKFPVPVTFESNGKTYVVEKDTWINLNKCTPTSEGASSTAQSGISLIYDVIDADKLEYKQAKKANGMAKAIDVQVPGMGECTSYRNFYSKGDYKNDPDKQFNYGLNYTFRILASGNECVDGTVEFYTMAINDIINYERIAKGEELTTDQVEASVLALKFKGSVNNKRTPSIGDGIEDKEAAGDFGRAVYHDGFMADSGAYKSAKIDIVGRIGNLALEDVADFRYSNLFKQVKGDHSWLIDGVVRATDPTIPNTIGAEPIDIYGYKVGNFIKGTDMSTDVVVTHSVFNISRYTGMAKVTSDNGYPIGNSGKLDNIVGRDGDGKIVVDRKWFSLPLTPANNNLAEYKTQAVKMGYDAFFDIETIGNYYGNNGVNEGPSNWNPSEVNDGDTRKQVMTIIPHYFLYDYTNGTWEDDIKIWYGESANYVLCYDNGKTISDITSGLYQDVMKEGNRRNVSGLFDFVTGNMYSEGGLTRLAMDRSSPTNNFDTNALNSGTRWIGNSSKIVLDGYDRNFIGSWMFYQKTDNYGYDSTLGQRVLNGQPNWPSSINWGLADVDFATQSQRWFFKIGLPSSAYISTSTYYEPGTGVKKNIINGSSIDQSGIMYSHEQLQEKHPNSILICYLDITVVGETYTLKYRGLHGTEDILVFDPETPDKPGNPTDNPKWTPPGNIVPEPTPGTPPSPTKNPADPSWEPVITYDPWDNSSTDLATYGTH